jgi:fucose 4-O-acetylase-like acetyltransferase
MRVRWVDYAKGIGIFLVVLGHVIRSLKFSSLVEHSGIIAVMDQWIYAFHMPLFFFISGLFATRSSSKTLFETLISKIRVLVYPYVLWSLIQGIIHVLVSRYTNQQSSFTDLWKIIYAPSIQFWFLYALFVVTLIHSLSQKLRISSTVFLLFSTLIYFLPVDVSFSEVLSKIKINTLFFAFGLMVNERIGLETKDTRTPPLLFVVFSGFALVLFWTQFYATDITEGDSIYLLRAIFGISASVALAVLLERVTFAKFVEEWGKLSLEIYLTHIIVISGLRIILVKFLDVTEPVIHLVIGVISGVYMPILFARFCQKINFQLIFRLPARSKTI